MKRDDPGFFDVSLSQRPSAGETFEKIVQRRLSRRSFLVSSAAAAMLAPSRAFPLGDERAGGLSFEPVTPSAADRVTIPDAYKFDVLIRWGDSLNPAIPDLDAAQIPNGVLLNAGEGSKQAQRFGYNNDAIEYFPLEKKGQHNVRGLICVNHEYTTGAFLFPGHPTGDASAFKAANPEAVLVEKAAHGISVVEIVETVQGPNRFWSYVKNSVYNRRITADTEIDISGPAAGHALLKTAGDPAGRLVKGTLNNCSGGQTPYGTFLSAEENFDQYFYNDAGARLPVATQRAYARIPLPASNNDLAWHVADPRFKTSAEPNEAVRFGWVVELDPADPSRRPVKRTALGRFKHENAATIVAPDGRLAVYMGDDARFEYVYKFVTQASITGNKAEDWGKLDHGTLYAAKFNDDGSGVWLPLVHGAGPLTAANGFDSQADILIRAREAADLLGATPMDRPEDVEANPKTRKVYAAFTNNSGRNAAAGALSSEGGRGNLAVNPNSPAVPAQPNPANPRPNNREGHIIEITESGGNNAATSFSWQIFMLCGDPRAKGGRFIISSEELLHRTAPGAGGPPAQRNLDRRDTYYAGFKAQDKLPPIGSPDNLAFDKAGNLWVLTDGNPNLAVGSMDGKQFNDGLFAVATEGQERGYLKQFLAGPVGCEVCGGEFTPHDSALFISIQHPGENGTMAAPTSHWPDGGISQPRPSVIAITKKGSPDGVIGS